MGKGGSGSPSQAEIDRQMAQQEAMYTRQMELQNKYQREAEERLRFEREREKQLEYLKRQTAAEQKGVKREQEEQQEAAVFREMTGQTSEEDTSDFGGGFNLDMPTIERPGYEQEDRPL